MKTDTMVHDEVSSKLIDSKSLTHMKFDEI